MRTTAVVGACVFGGLILLLPEIRWFRRRSLTERLRLYTAGAASSATPSRDPGASVWHALVPLAAVTGDRLSRLLNWHEGLATRLERVHAIVDVTRFRLRQLGWAVGAFGATATVSVGVGAPTIIALSATMAAPVAGFVAPEVRLAHRAAIRETSVLQELPVIAEQLGMLLGAGYSLTAAIERLAMRGQGAVARDLRRVCVRISHGLTETQALREWAAISAVPAVGRLVAVLALNREATDLSRLVADEARATRREVHRSLVERIDRRGQQVWVPVTVATLVPGVIFLAVPFIEALRLFAST